MTFYEGISLDIIAGSLDLGIGTYGNEQLSVANKPICCRWHGIETKRRGDIYDRPKAACKPSSVPGLKAVYTPPERSFLPLRGPVATIYLALTLPPGSSGQPGDGPGPLVPLLGLAPDGVCLASDVTIRAVSSYLAVSPLPR